MIYAAFVVGCWSWMARWPGRQTTRVLCRILAMRGGPRRLAWSGLAKLGEVRDLVDVHRAGLFA